jgi:hypothetical protein
MIQDVALQRYAKLAIVELGISSWRVSGARLMTDKGFPMLCFWVFDDKANAYAFSFALRDETRPEEDWIKEEIKAELKKLLPAED